MFPTDPEMPSPMETTPMLNDKDSDIGWQHLCDVAMQISDISDFSAELLKGHSMNKKAASVVLGGVDVDEVRVVGVDNVEFLVVGVDVDEIGDDGVGDDEEVDTGCGVVTLGVTDDVVVVDVIVVHVVVVIISAKQTSSSQTYIKVHIQKFMPGVRIPDQGSNHNLHSVDCWASHTLLHLSAGC